MAPTCLAFLFLLTGADSRPADGREARLPVALARVEERRQRIKTASIEWSLTEYQALTNAPATSASPRTVFYSTELTGGEALRINFGDEQGVVRRTIDGAPVRGNQDTLGALFREGEIWSYQRGSATAKLHALGRFIPPEDLRSLGLSPLLDHRSVHSLLHEEMGGEPASREYTERTEKGLTVVEGKADYGTYSWWVDPRKGGEVVRATFADVSGVVLETRAVLGRFGDEWFPESVEVYRRDFAEGKAPAEVIRVLSFECNRPEHPRELFPADLGMECGVQVQKYDSSGKMVETLMFDGRRAVPVKEFFDRLEKGEIQRGPTIERLLAEGRARREQWERDSGLSIVDLFPRRFPFNADPRLALESEWERYTREFIARFELNEDQRQKAWEICRQCEERARQYVNNHEDARAELKRHAAELARQKDAEADVRRQDLLRKRDDLLAPINAIFENELKPRLDELPTRAQRTRAERPAPAAVPPSASQP
ncbi:MAG: hypothetical protein HRF50_02480 [Phycisphaerae bacterium]|jgi:hypothetical protein